MLAQMLSRAFRHLTGKSTRPRPVGRSPRYAVLRVESLEARAVPAIVLNPTNLTLPAGNVASHYHETFSASGGVAPYQFTSTTLPNGLKLNATTGVLSGTPTAQNVFHFSVTATDSTTGTHLTQTNNYTLTVNQGKPALVTFSIALSNVSLNGRLATFQVTVEDALKNRLPGDVVKLRLVTLGAVGPASFAAGSVLSGTTNANGVVTFSNLKIGTRGVYEIEADVGSIHAFSNSFSVDLHGRHSPA